MPPYNRFNGATFPMPPSSVPLWESQITTEIKMIAYLFIINKTTTLTLLKPLYIMPNIFSWVWNIFILFWDVRKKLYFLIDEPLFTKAITTTKPKRVLINEKILKFKMSIRKAAPHFYFNCIFLLTPVNSTDNQWVCCDMLIGTLTGWMERYLPSLKLCLVFRWDDLSSSFFFYVS